MANGGTMATSTLTLPDFLLARIAEQEDTARRALTETGGIPEGWDLRVVRAVASSVASVSVPVHVARTSPARVLAECEAKRAILEIAASTVAESAHVAKAYAEGGKVVASFVLLALAHPYADHPDFRAEWRA